MLIAEVLWETRMAIKSLEEIFGDLAPKLYELRERLENEADEEVVADETGLLIKELYRVTGDISRASIASFYPAVRELIPDWLQEAELIRHDRVREGYYDMHILKKGSGLFPFLEDLVCEAHPSDLAQAVYALMEYDKEKDEPPDDISHGHEIRAVVSELLGYLHQRLPQSAKEGEAIAEASCRYLLGIFLYRSHECAADFYRHAPDLFREAESLLRHIAACDPGANVQDLNSRVRDIPNTMDFQLDSGS
jgi:hypothetical protein